MRHEFLDVNAAVAERAALFVGFGDFRLERDDTLESGREVGHLPFLRLHCQWLAGGPACRQISGRPGGREGLGMVSRSIQPRAGRNTLTVPGSALHWPG